MTMNKKERAEFDQLKEQALLNRALRWTDPVVPDVPPPGFGADLTKGYLVLGESSEHARITEACSSSVHHGTDHRKTSTQGSRWLYSTRLLALRALRHTVEKRCANQLARIDSQINELTNPEPKEHA